jgi:hypothetical protein
MISRNEERTPLFTKAKPVALRNWRSASPYGPRECTPLARSGARHEFFQDREPDFHSQETSVGVKWKTQVQMT